ncbi:alpha/beta fold hydrolase [Sphingomonas chungangi]|uniref:alpha/beta fold hydrolase n=1 Tax=Sphingomonas chungangi TaxID=2683589 RepID=UPI001C669D95|nr:alpha/beta hydrolase [Sphingomonas chungangi]
MRHVARVQRIVLMEGLLGALPGAEAFLSKGAPWWFGFHMVPGLAERVLAGNESSYLDHFLAIGTVGQRGIEPTVRDAIVAAYSEPDALRCSLEYYRAMPDNAARIAAALAAARVTQPTLAISGGVVGDALAGQLGPICDDLSTAAIPDTAHIIPQEQPQRLAETIARFARDGSL